MHSSAFRPIAYNLWALSLNKKGEEEKYNKLSIMSRSSIEILQKAAFSSQEQKPTCYRVSTRSSSLFPSSFFNPINDDEYQRLRISSTWRGILRFSKAYFKFRYGRGWMYLRGIVSNVNFSFYMKIFRLGRQFVGEQKTTRRIIIPVIYHFLCAFFWRSTPSSKWSAILFDLIKRFMWNWRFIIRFKTGTEAVVLSRV